MVDTVALCTAGSTIAPDCTVLCPRRLKPLLLLSWYPSMPLIWGIFVCYHNLKTSKIYSIFLNCSLDILLWFCRAFWWHYMNMHLCMLDFGPIFVACNTVCNYFNVCSCSLSFPNNLTFRHRASCILGQAFHYSPKNAFYIFNQQIYFIIWYLLDRASLI